VAGAEVVVLLMNVFFWNLQSPGSSYCKMRRSNIIFASAIIMLPIFRLAVFAADLRRSKFVKFLF
jgi:hypothetical protein